MHAMDVARRHEILARYRPIAPKPPMLDNVPLPTEKTKGGSGGDRVPARTPRARKRGRGSCSDSSFASSSSSNKRSRTYVPVLPSPSVPSFARAYPLFNFSAASRPVNVDKLKEGEGGGGGGELLTLSLLPCSTPSSEVKEKDLDLNSDPVVVPTEKDLLGGLHKHRNVIVPQPVRPVGSSISIGCINEDHTTATLAPPTTKKPEEVEEEVESDMLPAVVSDSNNRVRLSNSAYKEMIGQPECLWLDTMVGGARPKAVSSRISGEVMLDLSGTPVPASSNGFSCKVKIEWACNGQKKHLNAPCDVVRLYCESKDYVFTWRFHISVATVTSCKAC